MVNAKKTLAAFTAALLAGAIGWVAVRASDHDDGETDRKSRSLNLTDLYVFRENDQDSASAPGNLVLIMNSNPRSVARQQYYFSTNARYEFHMTQRMNSADAVTGVDDVTLRFEFAAPDAANQQAMTVTSVRNGSTLSTTTTVGGGSILTTPITAAAVTNMASLGGATLRIFAGLREDPFFFDVEQFFKVRADRRANGAGGTVGFRTLDTAVDFARGYNVNAIVVSVPISFLANSTGATTFDVWETISVPQ
jgi:molybdopterin-binding protein